MRKYIALVLFFVCVLGLAACNQQEKESQRDSDSQEIMINTVTEIGRGTLKSAIQLSEEDAETIAKILKNENWITNGTTACVHDCAINLNGRWVYYHSGCGTFTEYDFSDIASFSAQVANDNDNVKYLVLTEKEQIAVNAIIQKYITLGTESELTEEN